MSSNEPGKRKSFPPFEPNPPPREKRGTGHGLYYQKDDTHPYQGKMQRDYHAYKTPNNAFKAASSRLNAEKEQWAPPTGAAKPADMATYGEGECYTPAGHQAMIQPTAVASGYAYQAHAGRQTFTEGHVGRAYENYDAFKGHRKQTLDLSRTHGNLRRQEAQHVKYSTSVSFHCWDPLSTELRLTLVKPETPGSYAESSEGFRP